MQCFVNPVVLRKNVKGSVSLNYLNTPSMSAMLLDARQRAPGRCGSARLLSKR